MGSESEENQQVNEESQEIATESAEESEIGTLSDSSGENKIKRGLEFESPHPSFCRITSEHCRVIYLENTGSYLKSSVICLKKSNCRCSVGGFNHKTKRQNHPESMVPPGIYSVVVNTKGTVIGGKPNTRRNEEEFKAYLKKENLEAAKLAFGLEGLSKTMQAEYRITQEPEEKPKSATKVKNENSPGSVRIKPEPVVLGDEQKPTLFTSPRASTISNKRASFYDRFKNEEPTKVSPDLEERLWETMSQMFTKMEEKHAQQNNILLEALKSIQAHQTNTTPPKPVTTQQAKVKHEEKKEKTKSPRASKVKPPPKNAEESDESSLSRESKDDDLHKYLNTPRLWVIASGRYNPECVGFYTVSYHDIKFLISGVNGQAHISINSYKEGFDYIKAHLKLCGIKFPKWLRREKPFYPDLEELRRRYKKEKKKKGKERRSQAHNPDDSGPSSDSSSSSSDESQTDSGSDDSTVIEKNSSKKKSSKSKSRSTDSKKPHISIFDTTNVVRTDESLGKSDKLFGVGIDNHHELVKGLTPEGMGTETAETFFNQIDDFAAYPKTQGKTVNNEALRDLSVLAKSMLSSRKSSFTGQLDTGYQDSSRNFLLTFVKEKDDEKLRDTADSLSSAEKGLLSRFIGKLCGVLQEVYHYNDPDEVKAMAMTTLVYRIGRDTLVFYLGLLTHHISMKAKKDWPDIRFSLVYHGKKMAEIRQLYHTRAQIICALYIYLRDGDKAKWTNLKLVQSQVDRFHKDFVKQMEDLGAATKKTVPTLKTPDPNTEKQGAGTPMCNWCRTSLHQGGKQQCPWKAKSRGEAQKAGRAYMRAVSEGYCQEITDDNSDGDDSEPPLADDKKIKKK